MSPRFIMEKLIASTVTLTELTAILSETFAVIFTMSVVNGLIEEIENEFIVGGVISFVVTVLELNHCVHAVSPYPLLTRQENIVFEFPVTLVPSNVVEFIFVVSCVPLTYHNLF